MTVRVTRLGSGSGKRPHAVREAIARGEQTPMVRRRDAAQATLDKFRARPMRLGSRDCLRMVAFHLRQLGYPVRLPPAGSYKTTRGALRQLGKHGHVSLAGALDDFGLPRIVTAAAIVGDIVALPWLEGEEGKTHSLCALAVMLGNGRVVGYHESLAGADVLQPLQILAAWRAVPQERAG